MGKQITAHLTDEDTPAFLREADEKGLKPTAYAQAILAQRHSKIIEIADSDSLLLQARYEGQIEILKEQLAKAQHDVSLASEKAGLNGVERKKDSVQSQIETALAEERQRHEIESMKREIEDYRKMEEELEELKAQQSADARNERYVQLGGLALETITRVLPGTKEALESRINGLMGLPTLGALPDGNLTDEQSQALKAGTFIMQDFPGPSHQQAVVQILQFLSQNPNQIAMIRKTKAFVNWQQQTTQTGPTP